MREIVTQFIVSLNFQKICLVELIIEFTYQAIGLLEPHGINYESGGGDEEDLHERVVHRNEVPEYVHVPQQEDGQVHFLSLA